MLGGWPGHKAGHWYTWTWASVFSFLRPILPRLLLLEAEPGARSGPHSLLAAGGPGLPSSPHPGTLQAQDPNSADAMAP